MFKGNKKALRTTLKVVQKVVVIARDRNQYGKYFPSFLYFATYFTSLQASEIMAKYEKRGEYLPILYEEKCDNYFIVKCLLQSNVARVFLLISLLRRAFLIQDNVILTQYRQVEAKTASTNLAYLYFQIFDSFVLSCFNLNILYSILQFCI